MPTRGDENEGGVAVSDDIVAEFTLTKDEFVSAVTTSRRRQVLMLVFGLIGLLSLLFGAMTVNLPLGRHEGTTLLVIGAYELFIVWRIWSRPRRAWRKAHTLHGRQTMRFTESGVQMRTALTDSRFQWRLFGESRQEGALYLLRIAGRRGFFIVPRRGFSCVEEELAFRQLLARHTRATWRTA